ncbi:hypothetical protein D9758_018065 [Tetrapyrgos nigripes]|uniref:BED-type domain-containing protein n=1 Tax=Tetrapyrgos nigripes TaxID=182062 RepID=A0A8H5F4C3_9AGAR|nr:hypothetical protein D9758_018065 [Tetrapyrgos nigripes]
MGAYALSRPAFAQASILPTLLSVPSLPTISRTDTSLSNAQVIVSSIQHLSSSLPETIAMGQPDDKIPQCIDDEDAETPWARFNQFFDRVFGEDTRDENGRFKILLVGHLEWIWSIRIWLHYGGGDNDSGDTELEKGDKSYKLPRKSPVLSDDSVESFELDEDGLELVESVAGPSSAGAKRRQLDSSRSDGDGSDVVDVVKAKAKGKGKEKAVEKSSGGSAKQPPLKKAKAKNTDSHRLQLEDLADDISVGSESDGESALRSLDAGTTRGRRPGPGSDTLSHFRPAVLVSEPGKAGKRWKFRCMYCDATRTLAATGKVEVFEEEKPRPRITNLTSHIRSDHSEKLLSGAPSETPDNPVPPGLAGDGASARLLEKFIEKGRINPALVPTYKGFLQVFTAWILEDDLPFTTGKSTGLQRVFNYLKIEYKLPTDTTVHKVLDEIAEELRQNVVKELTAVNSKISYSHDVWTNRQMIFSFAGMMAHWIDDDWKLVERLADFKHLDSQEHVGQYAAKAFVKSASGRGGLNKITITMDNASSCDTMSTALVVQAILKALDEASSSEEEDYYMLNKEAPFHYQEEDNELREMEAEENVEVDEFTQDSDPSEIPANARLLSPVKQLRLIVTKIVSSPQRRTLF